MSPASPSIAKHYLRYSTSSALVLLAGLISFPILTRLLDNTQYGILGYYETWVLMAVAIGKLGAQHAILRFYPHGEDSARQLTFSTSLFYAPLAISMVVWIAGCFMLLALDLAAVLQLPVVLWLALLLVPFSIFSSLVETVLRATENSKMVVYRRVGSRWLELVLMIAAVALIQRSAVAVYSAKLLAALAIFMIYFGWVRRHLAFERASFEPAHLREGLFYGMPLVANELIAVALITLDRVMIKHMTDDFAAVGIYTIGFSLAMQVNVFTNLTVFEAFQPAANRLFATEGAAAVRALKARILMPMTYAAIVIACLLWCFGTDVIIALSGADKAESGPVFSVVGMTYALQPLLMIGGYGLLLERRSTKVLALMFVTLAINAVLNLLWIPEYGVMGAVYATALSSLAMALAHCLWVPESLRQLPDVRSVTTALAAGAASVGGATWACSALQLAAGWSRLLIGSALLAALYAAIVLPADPRMRLQLRSWLQRAGVAFAASNR